MNLLCDDTEAAALRCEEGNLHPALETLGPGLSPASGEGQEQSTVFVKSDSQGVRKQSSTISSNANLLLNMC